MKKINFILQAVAIITVFSGSCNGQISMLFASKSAAPGEKGLDLFELSHKEGKLRMVSETDAGPNPLYFCISKKNRLIYAANEVTTLNGEKGGGVTTLKYDSKTGVIEKVGELSIPNGAPCFISLSPSNNFLLFANYTGGSIAIVKLDENGIPAAVTDTIQFKREEKKASHAHMIAFDPSGKLVYMTDLGLDRILIYKLDNISGKLNQIPNGMVSFPNGTGPRHFVFRADGKKLFVIGELNSTISVFNVEESGELKPLQTITTLDAGYTGQNACADIHISKKGDFLYGSNRGENTIVTFKIGSDGILTKAGRTTCGGNWPRNFVIDPTGKFLLVGNQKSNDISVFNIDKKTGLPVDNGNKVAIKSPTCLKFLNVN